MNREKTALSKNIKGTNKTIRMQNVLSTRRNYIAICLPVPNRRAAKKFKLFSWLYLTFNILNLRRFNNYIFYFVFPLVKDEI